MIKMQKRGFTLIELLMTLIVIAIVSLIVTPIILNFMNDASYGSARNSAYGLLDAAKSYHTLEMEDKGVTNSVTITFPNAIDKFEYKGKIPESGTLVIDADGKTVLQAKIGKYCATKEKTTDKVTITKFVTTCSIATAGNLVKNGQLELKNNTNFKNFTYNSGGYLVQASRGNFSSDELIPIDPNKTYIQSVDAKSSNTSATYYMGLFEYDIDQLLISAYNVLYVGNTTTTLTRDLKNGDTVVYLNSTANFLNASTTPTYQLGFIFWNYTDSTGKTWPEHTYSRNIWNNLYLYSGINKSNNTITLKTAWNKGTFKAGTKVSQSSDGGNYNYGLRGGGTLTTDWKTYSNTITGIGTGYYTKFRHGTRYVKFLTLNNHNNTASTTTYYRNIILKEK